MGSGFSGDWSISTPSRDSLEGFNYVLEFDQPFYYDPSKGNLLMDWICSGPYTRSPSNFPILDGQWFTEKTHFGFINTDDPYST
jgi:hypothetical protein